MDASPGSRDPGSSEEVECLTGRYAGDNQKGQCTVLFHKRTPAVRAVQFQANRKDKKGKLRKENKMHEKNKTEFGKDGPLTSARIHGLLNPGRLIWASSEVGEL